MELFCIPQQSLRYSGFYMGDANEPVDQDALVLEITPLKISSKGAARNLKSRASMKSR